MISKNNRGLPTRSKGGKLTSGETISKGFNSNRPMSPSNVLSSSFNSTSNNQELFHVPGTEENVSLQTAIIKLEEDKRRSDEKYITRERELNIRIDELEEELENQKKVKNKWMEGDEKIGDLRVIHSQIMNNVGLIQERTAKILQEQERDLLRAFRSRLYDVQIELEKEKNRKDDGAAVWIEKTGKLEAEIEWAKEVADRLERVNQTLLVENNRLKNDKKNKEDDYNLITKQLNSYKNENAKLKAEYERVILENEHHKKQIEKLKENEFLAPTLNKSAMATKISQENEEKYKEFNVRLKRLLTEERKNLSILRNNYSQELKNRTEMELLLRQCVEDVRQEISRRYVNEGTIVNNSTNTNNTDLIKLYINNPSLIPVENFLQNDRERVLELLLSQERVVSLIYSKTFPINNTTTNPNQFTNQSNNFSFENNPSGSNINPEIANLVDASIKDISDSSNRPGTTGALGSMNQSPSLLGSSISSSALVPTSQSQFSSTGTKLPNIGKK